MKRRTYRFWFPPGAVLGAALLLMTLNGCSAGFGCGAGFSVNNAALEITGITDARTHAALSRVVLSNFRLNGTTVTDLQSLVPPQLAHGVTTDGDTLVCTIPCAFGRDAGTYQFTATASGYKPADEAFKGAPIFNDGSCPNFTIGSTQIQFALEPQ